MANFNLLYNNISSFVFSPQETTEGLPVTVGLAVVTGFGALAFSEVLINFFLFLIGFSHHIFYRTKNSKTVTCTCHQ
jgi:phosphatidylserine synthase